MEEMKEGAAYEQLKAAVRKLREGGFYPGADLVHLGDVEYLVTERVVYKVQGQERLRLVPVMPGNVSQAVRTALLREGPYEPPADPTPQPAEAAPEEPQAAPSTAPVPEAQGKPRPVQREQKERFEEVACRQCGATFRRSKFNPYFDTCNACRKKDRRTGGQDRRFTCVKCGKEFWISKYQPYLNPDACPHCHRNACIRRRQKRKAAEERAERQSLGTVR